MSKELLQWARKQHVGCQHAKAVLVEMAYRARPGKTEVVVSHRDLADMLEKSLSTIKRAVAHLVSRGFISQQVRATSRGHRAPSGYHFLGVSLTPRPKVQSDTLAKVSGRTSNITNLLSSSRSLVGITYPLGETLDVGRDAWPGPNDAALNRGADLYALIAREEVPQ